MKIFMKLKAFFNKNISILPYQKVDMVSFVRLRSNSIKINSYVTVEENFNFVLVYYNKVCDILPEGNHKLNEDTIPKLYRFSKTPFGLKALTTRSIVTDAYYINLKDFDNNNFRTIDRVIALNEGQKVRIKLSGNFSMKVVDTLKFMKALCNDYAVIRNKKTMKEICSTVGYEVSKALNSKNYSIDDYVFNQDKIIATIEEYVNNHTKTFGIEVSKFSINNFDVNKKYLNEVQLTALEQVQGINENIVNEELSNLVNSEQDSLQKEESIVYVGDSCEKKKSGKNKEGINEIKIINDNFVTKEESTNNQQKTNKNDIDINKALEETANKILENNCNKTFKNEEDIFIKDNNSNLNFAKKEVSSNKPKIDNDAFLKQPEPMILVRSFEEDIIIKKTNETQDKIPSKKIKPEKEKSELVTNKNNKEKVTRKKCNNCGQETIENNAKFCNKCGNNLSDYKICACCGAKNLIEDKKCCVCKSLLD